MFAAGFVTANFAQDFWLFLQSAAIAGIASRTAVGQTAVATEKKASRSISPLLEPICMKFEISVVNDGCQKVVWKLLSALLVLLCGNGNRCVYFAVREWLQSEQLLNMLTREQQHLYRNDHMSSS